MTANRKSIGKKLRFTIFERDGFRCRYCGIGQDQAVMHIDHRLAVANGGTNDSENLLTACADCNLGKGARELLTAPSRGLVTCPFAEGWPQDIEDPVYFANANWVVTDYGLECLSEFYPIEKARLGDVRDSMSDWLLHLSEKLQFASTFEDLASAFRRALIHHQTAIRFDLDRSISVASREAIDTIRDNRS